MEVREISPQYVLKASQHRTSSLPVDWKLIRVQDAGEVLGGRQRSPSAQGDLTPYLRVANVFAGRIDTSDVLQMPFTAEERARFALRAGDILLNEGQSLELVGRSAIYRDEPPNCCFQNTLVRFRAGSRTDPTFAQYLFESYMLRGEFSKIALQTTSIAHLGAGRFAQMAFVAPPLEEQKAIGQSLADADALIDSLEQLLTKKRQIKQGTMQELLTGKRRLPGFHGPWSEVRLGEVGRTYGGLTGKGKADFGHGAAKYITFMNVMTTVRTSTEMVESVEVGPSESQNMVQAGDLLFNGSSETPEEVALCSWVEVCDDGVFLNSFCFGFRAFAADRLSGLFMAYFFRGGPGRTAVSSLAQGATRYNIAKTALLRAPICLPSLAEQQAIAEVLSSIDTEIATLESRLTKARALKQAMAQALLTGRIRIPLSPQAPNLPVSPPEGVGALGSGPARPREPTA